MKKILFTHLFAFLLSCQYSSTNDVACKKIQLNESAFVKLSFNELPADVKLKIIELATIQKKMDTVLSLDKTIKYSYRNPGDNKGYVEQVMKSRQMHWINNKCYEFVLYTFPYIVYQEKIYSFEQGLGFDCSSGKCVPDTSGLHETVLYVLPINKIPEYPKRP